MNSVNEDTFEPTKLLAVTQRLHEWAKNGEAQEHCDARWVLRDHFQLFQEREKLEKRLYYICKGEDGYYVTWQERAEELERKLDAADKYIKSLPQKFPTDQDKHVKAAYDAAMEAINQ